MSKTLKELTWEQHKNAERQWFEKQMITGRVEPSVYHKYLVNQYACYDALESNYGVPVNAIARAKAIMQDIEYFTPNEFELYPSVQHYVEHVANGLTNGQHAGHVYVRYMGDLSGGQMISSKVPGPGHYYKFQGKTDELKQAIRDYIAQFDQDEVANEAKVVFDFATALFEDIEKDVNSNI